MELFWLLKLTKKVHYVLIPNFFVMINKILLIKKLILVVVPVCPWSGSSPSTFNQAPTFLSLFATETEANIESR